MLSCSEGSLVCVVIWSCQRSCQTETDQRVPSGSATGAIISVAVSAIRWHLQLASSCGCALGLTEAPLGGGGGRGHVPCAHCHSRSSRQSLANSSISSVPGGARALCAWRVCAWRVCIACVCAWRVRVACTASACTACGEGSIMTAHGCYGRERCSLCYKERVARGRVRPPLRSLS